jgi:hypothetical protein
MKTKSKADVTTPVKVPQQRMPEGTTAPAPEVPARGRPESRRVGKVTMLLVGLGAVLAAAIGSLVIAFSASDSGTAPTSPAPQGPANPGGRPYEDKVGGGTAEATRPKVSDGSDMSKYLAAIERGARLRAEREAAAGSDRRLENLARERAADPGRFGRPGMP